MHDVQRRSSGTRRGFIRRVPWNVVFDTMTIEAPKRVQLKRTKGWRMPENTVNCARPGKWGNPFSIAPKQTPGTTVSSWGYIAVPTLEDAIDCHRIWLLENPEGMALAEEAKKELRGKNLACWCKLGTPCHVDTLLMVSNVEVQRRAGIIGTSAGTTGSTTRGQG